MKRLHHHKKNVFVIIGVALFGLAGCAGAQQNKSPFTPDAHTVMLLEPGANGTMTDAKNTFTARVKGATAIDDPRFGKVLQFGNADGNGITVADGGHMNFTHGITLEMWLYLPDSGPYSGELFQKKGSFDLTLKNNNLNVEMDFPTVPVATSTPQQFSYYPVGNPYFNGRLPIAPGQWTHVAVTYDPVLNVIRSWIDDGLDRTCYAVLNQGGMTLENSPWHILQGMKNLRVAAIRVSDTARAINTLPPLETYINALPYRGQIAVTFDHIDPAALPLNVVMEWDNPNGDPVEYQRFPLTAATRKDVVFAPSGWKNDLYMLTIRVFAGNHEVYSKSTQVYNGEKPKPAVGNTVIDDQNRLFIDGRPVFPLMSYGVPIEDFPTMAKIGMNIISPKAPPGNILFTLSRSQADIDLVHHYLAVAAENHVTLLLPGNSGKLLTVDAQKDQPGLSVWYVADEPWGNLERLRNSYNMVKLLDHGRHPVWSVQNNLTRLQETAEGVDIIGCDPYPIPNVSLRYVADATKACVSAVGGLKPVWAVLPQYESKLPTVEELRCMAYLAIASGANGLGFYAWDERNAKTKAGWYTGEHPEDVKILGTVVGELAKMQDVLLIPNSTRALTLAPTNPALHVALKESGKDVYLLAVNDSRRAEESTLSLDGIQSAEGTGVREASEKIAIRGGKVLLQLPPLGVRIYKLADAQ